MSVFTEPPKTIDPIEILKYFQDQAYKPSTEQSGIAARPVTGDKADSVMQFFADLFTDSEEKVVKAREELAPDMEEISRRSAEEAALYRMEEGITDARGSLGDAITQAIEADATPVVDSGSTSKAEQESAPVTAETQGDGLMSSPRPQARGVLVSPRPQARPVEEEETPVETAAPVTEETPAGAGLMSPRSDTKGLTPITQVDKAQQKLHDLGFVEVGAADGAAGANTRAAARRYQEENGLPVTGQLDGPTLDGLTAESADLDKIMERQITHHEGKKNYPYKDTLGKWTIGIGHLIGKGKDKDLADSDYAQYSRENPMPDSEVSELFQEDLEHHKAIAEGYDFYDDMSEEGKRAILDLTFNMGDFYNKKKEDGTYMWKVLRRQIQAGDWEGAANNLASATYGRQVGQRAVTVTDLLRQAGE